MAVGATPDYRFRLVATPAIADPLPPTSRRSRRLSLRRTDAPLTAHHHALAMTDKDLLALVLGGVALLMFATGIILAI